MLACAEVSPGVAHACLRGGLGAGDIQAKAESIAVSKPSLCEAGRGGIDLTGTVLPKPSPRLSGVAPAPTGVVGTPPPPTGVPRVPPAPTALPADTPTEELVPGRATAGRPP